MNNSLLYFLNTHGVFIMVFLVLLLLYQSEKRELLKHTLLIVITTLVSVVLLKEIFNMPRPFQREETLPLAGLTYFQSFPSAHAALAFSVSTIIALHNRRLGIFLLILSTLISLGRVQANVHDPIDIGFGILLGVCIALFFDTFHIRPKLKKRHA